MSFEEERKHIEAIERAAELYRYDPRIRALIDSSIMHARQSEGRIDPEDADRDANELATLACALLAARILHEDAELRNTRAERDHYRNTALDTLSLTPRPMMVPNEFLSFVKQARKDGSIKEENS